MAKEPAGLRRWRLAHRKKRRRRVRVVARRRRGRRYGRKGHGRKGSRAFPILLAAPVIPGFIQAYNERGSGAVQAVRGGVYKVSGIDLKGELPLAMDNVWKTVGLVIVGMVGHKIANKVGINRMMKKATLGYLQL